MAQQLTEEDPDLILTERIIIRVAPEHLRMLEAIEEAFYRGVKHSQAIRWLITDGYKKVLEGRETKGGL